MQKKPVPGPHRQWRGLPGFELNQDSSHARLQQDLYHCRIIGLGMGCRLYRHKASKTFRLPRSMDSTRSLISLVGAPGGRLGVSGARRETESPTEGAMQEREKGKGKGTQRAVWKALGDEFYTCLRVGLADIIWPAPDVIPDAVRLVTGRKPHIFVHENLHTGGKLVLVEMRRTKRAARRPETRQWLPPKR